MILVCILSACSARKLPHGGDREAAAVPELTQSDYGQYANGNGTIIETKTDGETKWIRRKHDQRIQIGDLSINERLIVYNDPLSGNNTELFRLKLDDNITITEVISEEDIKNDVRKIWLKISTAQGNIGWINIGDRDPYEDNRWSIMEIITTNGKQWTVRKQESTLSIWETLKVRDKPGLGSTVLFDLIPLLPQDNNGWTFFVDGFAITEETDTINGRKDHWVKIIDKQGRSGWIFGDDGGLERGGPKYLTPEEIVYDRLGYF